MYHSTLTHVIAETEMSNNLQTGDLGKKLEKLGGLRAGDPVGR
jgi:hypothetical protein